MTVLYILALIVFVVGTYGLFGFEKDPLSGVYLVILGWPWPGLTQDLPDQLLPVAGIAAPLINIVILQVFGSWFAALRRT